MVKQTAISVERAGTVQHRCPVMLVRDLNDIKRLLVRAFRRVGGEALMKMFRKFCLWYLYCRFSAWPDLHSRFLR